MNTHVHEAAGGERVGPHGASARLKGSSLFSVEWSQGLAAHHGKAGAAGCGLIVPEGRPKIAQRFIAGPAADSQKVPQGRKNPPLVPGAGRA